jgi:aryl-alcohol dehydrogenase-like predicted oxidoreductase
MRYRTLGHSTLRVSTIGLGLMSMSGIYGKSDEEESIAVIHHAIDRGINLLDCSDTYGWGRTEQLLGRAITGRRDRVVIITKFGQVKNPSGGPNLVNGRPEYAMQACDASLKRLGVEVIDLYFQHRVDPTVPIEETVGAMKRLVEQGKVRSIGLCEAKPATLRRAHSVHPLSAVQTEYSLLYRTEAEETLPTCRDLGISFVAYSPLGRGFLTGRVQSLSDIPEGDRRREHPRFREANFFHNLELVRRLEPIAREKDCTLGQLALAWLAAQGDDTIPIPGTKRKDRVDENLGAGDIRLGPADIKRIAEAIPAGAAAGPRYPEPQMKGVYL